MPPPGVNGAPRHWTRADQRFFRNYSRLEDADDWMYPAFAGGDALRRALDKDRRKHGPRSSAHYRRRPPASNFNRGVNILRRTLRYAGRNMTIMRLAPPVITVVED